MTESTVDLLADNIRETHDVLAARLSEAKGCRPTREKPRDRCRATDPFLASTSRHIAAANAVLLPAAARHLGDGHKLAHDFARQSKRLEQALAQAKGKLYGSTFVVRRSWDSIWEEVEHELAALREMEGALVADLVEATDEPVRAMIADRLYRTEQKVPTRPHPYLPHLGVTGKLARRVALRVDRFWDTAEGRMIPDPVRPRRQQEGRLTQYLLAHHADLPD